MPSMTTASVMMAVCAMTAVRVGVTGVASSINKETGVAIRIERNVIDVVLGVRRITESKINEGRFQAGLHFPRLGLFFWSNCVFCSFGHAELAHGLGWNLDSLTSLGIAS